MNFQFIVNCIIIFTCFFLIAMATEKKESEKENTKTSETAHSVPHVEVLEVKTQAEAKDILHTLNDIGKAEEDMGSDGKTQPLDVEDKQKKSKEQDILDKDAGDPAWNISVERGDTNVTSQGSGTGTTPAASLTTETTIKTLAAPPLQTEGKSCIYVGPC